MKHSPAGVPTKCSITTQRLFAASAHDDPRVAHDLRGCVAPLMHDVDRLIRRRACGADRAHAVLEKAPGSDLRARWVGARRLARRMRPLRPDHVSDHCSSVSSVMPGGCALDAWTARACSDRRRTRCACRRRRSSRVMRAERRRRRSRPARTCALPAGAGSCTSSLPARCVGNPAATKRSSAARAQLDERIVAPVSAASSNALR